MEESMAERIRTQLPRRLNRKNEVAAECIMESGIESHSIPKLQQSTAMCHVIIDVARLGIVRSPA